MPYPKFWTPDKLAKLKSLYDSGLSMREVGNYFKKSVNSIAKIMARENIDRRLASQTRTAYFLSSPLSFTSKTKLSIQKIKLKVAGLMLYWGEGAKRNANRIDFANSDPQMILVFLKFLRDIYQVDENRFRIYLYSYNSLSTDELITYWSNLTKIPPSQFSKPYIKPKVI